MTDTDKGRGEELPSVRRGVGGAGRVQGMLTDEKANDPGTTLRRLWGTLGPFRVLFIGAMGLTLVATMAGVLAPRLIGQIITLISETLLGEAPLPWLAIRRIMLVLGLLYLVHFAATYVANTTMVRVTQRIIASLRKKMDTKLNRVPLNFFDTSSAGDTSSLLSNDLDNVSGTLQSGLTSSINAVVMMVGVGVMMLIINPLLTLLAVAVVPLSAWAVKALVKRSRPIFRRSASTTGELNGQIEEAFQGEAVVRGYHLEDSLKGRVKALNDELYESEWRSSFVSFLARPAGDLMVNVDYVLVSVVGGWYVMTGVMPIGDFQAFISYTRMFTSPFSRVLGIVNTIMSALASAERIFVFLDEQEIVEPGSDRLDPTQVEGRIELDRVDFAYVPEKPLFVDVSLSVEPGRQIAIVGPTGAGKTTLVNLLLRFYEIQEGAIRLDGKDTRSWLTDELRGAYAMVLQDTWLFEGTIRENIAYGASLQPGQDLNEVPIADIQAAARLARAESFIERLPGGYDTVLTEGAVNISQGQRQLLTIARAMMKKAPIVILDEATSSVDTRTEVLIQHGMKELTSNRTSFIIAHRLSTIREADQILVMENGSIVEVGTHGELLQRRGLYAELYRAGQASADAA